MVALLAGLTAAVMAVLVGSSWRQIYYAIYPEARFWGRWMVVDSDDHFLKHLVVDLSRQLVLEVRREGELQFHDVAEGVLLSSTYRVTRDTVAFSPVAFLRRAAGSPASASAKLRFRGHDALELQFQSVGILGDEKCLTLRRMTVP